MSDSCGSVTEDGSAVCVPGSCSCSTETKNSQPIVLSIPSLTINKNQEQNMWQKIRSGVIFGIACIASPCCTPIIVPIGIALLAGTPFAVWMSANLGWVYGGLTLLSGVSLVLGIRWMNQNKKKIEPKTKIHSIQEVNQS